MVVKDSLFGLRFSLLAVLSALFALWTSGLRRAPGEASAPDLPPPDALLQISCRQTEWPRDAVPEGQRLLSFRVPPRSLVILHSLDITGCLHEFHMSIANQNDAADITAELEGITSPGISELPEAVAGMEPPVQIERPRAHGPDAALPTTLRGSRQVLLPQFTSAGLCDLPTECSCIFVGQAVVVYADPHLSLLPDLPTRSLCDSLDHQVRRAAGTLRTLIETTLGPIDDLDGDGRLTVVLSDLDRRKRDRHPERDQIPVWGCVREADFLESSGTSGGDILYLAPEGLKSHSGSALLAHELAHAAVHCRQRERLRSGRPKIRIPEWFHEALAHVAEHSAAGPGAFFDQRLADFQVCPQACPVVMDSRIGWQAGRGGSRVAGFLFLQSSLSDLGRVPGLLSTCESFDELLDGVLRQALPECLAAWGPAAAEQIRRTRPNAIPELQAGNAQSGLIYGTAFRCWRNGDAALTIEVTSQEAADLRLSVVRVKDADGVADAN